MIVAHTSWQWVPPVALALVGLIAYGFYLGIKKILTKP